jgi:hypothetical protein
VGIVLTRPGGILGVAMVAECWMGGLCVGLEAEGFAGVRGRKGRVRRELKGWSCGGGGLR